MAITGNSGTMLAELDKYYRRQRISATAFDGKNYCQCSAGCARHEFVTGWRILWFLPDGVSRAANTIA
jgi:hypothetical protein